MDTLERGATRDSAGFAYEGTTRKRSSYLFNHGHKASIYRGYCGTARGGLSTATALSLDQGGEAGELGHGGEVGGRSGVETASMLNSGEYGLSYMACQRCGCRLEAYSDDTLGSLVVICSTLVYRESELAAPFILDMLMAAIRLAQKKVFTWQATAPNFYLPGNYASVAKQFIRCVLHQFQNNEILYQLFQGEFDTNSHFELIAIALADLPELNSVAALRQIISDLNLQKPLNMQICLTVLNNVAIYMNHLPIEVSIFGLLLTRKIQFWFRQFDGGLEWVNIFFEKSKFN